MNDQQKQQVIEQIKNSNHVLVTVSANPTVDELAASIGLTLAINKMDKHATTVFSGHVPSTIEFLQPEKTIETTTDSLRDFIIALDKSKADKLRYKVEDDVVRIFITPYRTTITDKDLEFSQGDFNVDLVIGLGVTKRQDLDIAISAHGRILHDATIVALTKREAISDLGSINWQDPQASSLCEMVTSVVAEIQPEVIDGQMATAFLTGIIAETDRFKNDRTTPTALSLSSNLMSAGANQQLIAEKLEEPEAAPQLHTEEFSVGQQEQSQNADGALEIDHSEDPIDNIHIDDDGNLNLLDISDQNSNEELPEIPIETATVEDNPYQEKIDNEDFQTSVAPGYVSSPPQNDQENDLFEELPPQDVDDHDVDNNEDQATLSQPGSDTPMMQHGLVIQPPVHPGDVPKSDKAFDPLEAMQAVGVPQQMQPSVPQENSTIDESPSVVPPTFINDASDVPQELSTEPIDNPMPLAETPSGDSLADLEKTVDSPHVSAEDNTQLADPSVDLKEVQDSITQAAESLSTVENPNEATVQFEAPKMDNAEPIQKEQKLDPNAPPPVPPPMTPQFYDAEGNNSNPFLNPHQ